MSPGTAFWLGIGAGGGGGGGGLLSVFPIGGRWAGMVQRCKDYWESYCRR